MGARRFLRLAIAGLLIFVALFASSLALGDPTPVTVVIAGVLLAAAAVVATGIRVGLLAHGEAIGTVRSVHTTDTHDRVRVLVDLPDGGRRPYLVTHSRRPGTDSCAAGDRVRVLVPMHDASKPLLLAPGLPEPDRIVLVVRGRHILVGRDRRLLRFLVGRADWANANVDEKLEQARVALHNGVRERLQSRYARFVLNEQQRPEFQRLRAAYPDAWPEVMKATLEDPLELYGEMRPWRTAIWRSVLPLAFLAIVASVFVVGYGDQFIQLAFRFCRALFDGAVLPADVARRWTDAVRASDLPLVDFYVVLACLVLLLITSGRALAAGVANWVATFKNWIEAAYGSIRDRLRSAYEDYANRQAGPVLSRMPTAPTLTDATAEQLVDRSETDQVRAYVFDFGAHAVAISGSRGVGKTTILRALTCSGRAEPLILGLMVSAPVRYEPRDFILHLYARLCETTLGHLGDQPPASRPRRAAAWLRRFLAHRMRGLVLLCLIAILLPGTRDLVAGRISVPRLAATYLALGLTLFIAARWIRGRVPNGEAKLAEEAARRLRQTRYLQTLSVEQSLGAAPPSTQLGWRKARQWVEQPHNLPDIVTAYREFAGEVAAWWREETDGRGKLVVAIDEIDRIAEPELAERFVNEVKAIFGVEHCVYLVSVSEEALANFERRVVRTRTVFDSAFDHVVRLRPMSLSDSVTLLRHRLSGVPAAFWILCHCLGGGMPRDVIRTARAMFDAHRRSDGVSGLAAIAEELVGIEVKSVKRGFQQRIAQEASEGKDPNLAERLADARWPVIGAAELQAAAQEQLGETDATEAATALAASLLYYSAVIQLFSHKASIVAKWQESLRKGDLDGALDTDPLAADLALAHQLLAADPSSAVHQLRRIQTHLGSE